MKYFFLILFNFHYGMAQEVLNFEANVIEGERLNPDLFTQMEVETPDLDTLIYIRKNFNDFHKVERNRRPKFQRPRRKGVKK